MKTAPREMTLQELRERINRSEGRVDIHAHIAVSELPLGEQSGFSTEIATQGLKLSFHTGMPELKVLKWVIFNEIPHTIYISGYKLSPGDS